MADTRSARDDKLYLVLLETGSLVVFTFSFSFYYKYDWGLSALVVGPVLWSLNFFFCTATAREWAYCAKPWKLPDSLIYGAICFAHLVVGTAFPLVVRHLSEFMRHVIGA